MYNPHEVEKEILKFWEKSKIYAKSKKKNSEGKPFYMMDGPPYANGSIHMGTALNKSLKDIAMRYHRLLGDSVFDRPGYDTHGVPIEFKVEKEIGSKSKKDIEEYGVKKFVERCKEFATEHIGVMNEEFANLGVWMDWNNPYITLKDEYMEAIWHSLKKAYEKKLLYLGKYPIHACSRCETAVAFNEIEYGKQYDASVYVKFPIKDEDKKFLVIWTTTPWTLPSNTGIMVHPETIYQEVEVSEGEIWIIAKPLVSDLMNTLERKYNVKNEYPGKKMRDLEYSNPLAKHLKIKLKKKPKVVIAARYVTTEEGTGLVHCAPGHGKEDYEVGKENHLDMICPVGINGLFDESGGKYEGKKARIVDKEIIADLNDLGFLVYEKKFTHDYPLCWRCKTPLLMLSQPQWFLKISGIQKALIKENKKINWVPKWMETRMDTWLNGISDWPISRERYWGTPLPIWVCDHCGKEKVIGSIDELKKLSKKSRIGMHKPEIDKITINCSCRKPMSRVSSVLDVWFDSGVSSWAALGYPSDKKNFEKFWPANLNIEGRDMVRGWWNSQIILSQITFDKKPFDSIVSHGMILDLGKKKMSKSEGNIVAPKEVIEKFGRDSMRYYFAKLSKGEDFKYDEKEFREIQNVIRVLTNLQTFLMQINRENVRENDLQIEDRWILSRFNSTIEKVRENYEKYHFQNAISEFEEFLVKDLSKTYIQIIRDRADDSFDVLHKIIVGILKMIAPIMPFVSDKLWQDLAKENLVEEESIHLSLFPNVDKKKIDSNLEKEFLDGLKVIESGLAERDKMKIGLKWPLAGVEVKSPGKIGSEMGEIIKRQLNVKDINVKKAEELVLNLDLKMTPELEAEGYSREVARKVQSERKIAGLKKGELVDLEIYCDKNVSTMLERHLEFMKARTNSRKISFSDGKIPNGANVFTVKENKIGINFRN